MRWAAPATETAQPVNAALPVRFESVQRVSIAHGQVGPKPVLHDISLRVRAGEAVAILGASSCGKLTDTIISLFERWATRRWA